MNLERRADPTNPADFYIADSSSRAITGQDLDIAAPGTWVVGPYQYQMGKTSYYFLGGTSMASPHVAGTVALMAQKKNALTASEAETILEGSAIYLAPGCLTRPTAFRRHARNSAGRRTPRAPACWMPSRPFWRHPDVCDRT